ncbi:MAG: BRO-N domain-containing protein [Enterobacteriaceae bacterium]
MKLKKSGVSRSGIPYAQNQGKAEKQQLAIEPENMSVLRFDDHQIRIINIGGEPWFVAKDVCLALEIADNRVALRRLDPSEKGGCSIPTLGGSQVLLAVSESGFYKLITRSRKASVPGTLAYQFSNWVFCEVIPSIRKNGSYGVPWTALNDFSRKKQAYIAHASKTGKALQACKQKKQRLTEEESRLWLTYQPSLSLLM